MKFTAFEQKTIEALDDCTGAVKHCAKNAIHHLEKAWLIRKIDLEMAIFRGITAEEEAASALFYCLKNNKYQNADKIQFKKHTYKLGLYPFLQSIGRFLLDLLSQDCVPFYKYHLQHIQKSKRRAIELVLTMREQNIEARPEPPLHFTVSDPGTGKAHTFNQNFKAFILDENYDDSLKYIKDVANLRNRLLYADSAGRPEVDENIEGYLLNKQQKVMGYLVVLLLIDPWEKEAGKSLFVQQALDSFLVLLGQISDDDISQPNNKIY
jgi:hypothetical protein